MNIEVVKVGQEDGVDDSMGSAEIKGHRQSRASRWRSFWVCVSMHGGRS